MNTGFAGLDETYLVDMLGRLIANLRFPILILFSFSLHWSMI